MQLIQSLNEWKVAAEILQSLVTTLSLLVGGTWVYLRYFRQVEHRPTPKVSVSERIVGAHNGFWLVEIKCVIENLGKVPYALTQIEVSTYFLRANDLIASSLHFKGEVHFGARFSKGLIVRDNYESIVDPGCATTYSHLCVVPLDAHFARFFVTVRAPKEKIRVFTAQTHCSLPVPTTNA